jgi:hypothetical protein
LRLVFDEGLLRKVIFVGCNAERDPTGRRDGAHSARAHEFGDGGQQVDGEYEQVNHRYGR